MSIKKNQRVIKKELHKINEKIISPTIRLVGDDITPGIYTLNDALKISEGMELDLVEISPNASPPVCKIVNYGKFLYEQKKKQPKPIKNTIKEIRLSPNISDHDLSFKRNHAIKFLTDGSKVKVSVFFKGRQIAYKSQGEIILLKFAQDLEDYGRVEQMPLLEGKNMRITIAPKKGK